RPIVPAISPSRLPSPSLFFLLPCPLPPPPPPPLFPYTTLFRSEQLPVLGGAALGRAGGDHGGRLEPRRPGGGVPPAAGEPRDRRSEEHTSELQSRFDLVCRLLLEKKKNIKRITASIMTVHTQ